MEEILRNRGASFSVQELRRARDSSWEWSIFDYASMDPSMFCDQQVGAEVIVAAKRMALRDMNKDLAESTRAAGSSAKTQSFGGIRQDAMFVPPKVKFHSFDLGAVVRKSSSKNAELSIEQQHAVSIVEFMDDSIKDEYLKGRDKLPREQQDLLIFNAVSRLAGKDTLRNVAASLRRLDEWVSGAFTKHHGFQIDTAIVAWFLSEMSIGEDEHVPQQLVTGLRTAATKLHFPISVHETIIRHIAKPPTRTPKQAPSSSVRVFYHFWQIADSIGFSIPLRAMAGSLRGYVCFSVARDRCSAVFFRYEASRS